MVAESAAGDIRASHASGAALTSLRDGSQHREQTTGTPMSQKLGALAIITATSRPTKLVRTFPRNIRQAARKRGSRRSKTANSADFTTTAIARTSIEPDRASAGTMTCMNGTTGSHARVGFAKRIDPPNRRSTWRFPILWTFPCKKNIRSPNTIVLGALNRACLFLLVHA